MLHELLLGTRHSARIDPPGASHALPIGLYSAWAAPTKRVTARATRVRNCMVCMWVIETWVESRWVGLLKRPESSPGASFIRQSEYEVSDAWCWKLRGPCFAASFRTADSHQHKVNSKRRLIRLCYPWQRPRRHTNYCDSKRTGKHFDTPAVAKFAPLGVSRVQSVESRT